MPSQPERQVQLGRKVSDYVAHARLSRERQPISVAEATVGRESQPEWGMDETGIDQDTMARLARVLSFIRSAEDPVVAALRQAAETGLPSDVKRARSLFLKLKPADRRAALAAIADSD